jgi:metal-sulfur cluster biosynthetic enzyme
MSDSRDDAAPQSAAAPAASRPLRDRELPVTSLDGARRPHPAAVSFAADQPSAPAATESTLPTPVGETEPLTEDQVKLALRRVKDPELNLNILDLGLVYEIRVDGNDVAIDMSLTSPGCPSGPEIMSDAERHLKAIPGVGNVAVNLVWSPFWSPDRIEPRVRAYLGF